ncbi:hypothetical protein BJ508DRAFT_329372 [Ascobolus immersus RN42]|uniref:F-box domain-containing protein n=1 Tax=Ascobolus immersus RN42 TaxID=1160509 RepID=A0A3N4I8W9_ASCIM|nr:hypothetical protein BJ508DRAFT_329372 [Ascobolus immersus RN42]
MAIMRQYRDNFEETAEGREQSLFMRLPLELRLDIYEFCSALTLLQLIGTSWQIRCELLTRPKLITGSFGYRHPNDLYGLKFEIASHLQRIQNETFLLSIEDVAKLSGKEEARYFISRHQKYILGDLWGRLPRTCCPKCNRILGEGAYRDFWSKEYYAYEAAGTPYGKRWYLGIEGTRVVWDACQNCIGRMREPDRREFLKNAKLFKDCRCGPAVQVTFTGEAGFDSEP